MAGCEPHTFTAVTPAMMECLSDAIERSFGLSLDGDRGSACAMGTTLLWDYARDAHELTLTCSAKPVFLPCSAIYGQIGSMLEKCRG